jgi:ribosomal protein S18 acetylase RimI-like enzyme
MIQKDEFLSYIFNMEWGKFSGNEHSRESLLSVVTKSDFNITDFEISSDNFEAISLLSEKGCLLTSSKVIYKHEKGDRKTFSSNSHSAFSVVSAHVNDVEEIAQIAIEDFVLDRYRNTLRRKKNKIVDLYTEWIRNNINYRCKDVMICKLSDDIAGFLCVIEEKDHYYFELIGVRHTMQGKGIGSYMLRKALSRFYDKDCLCITQIHNIPMQTLLQKEGFRIVKTNLIFTKRDMA